MKHILLLALATVLTMTMLTGCRNKDNKAESAVDGAVTTISEGLDDLTGTTKATNATEKRTESTSESTSESTQSNGNARSRRGINRR